MRDLMEQVERLGQQGQAAFKAKLANLEQREFVALRDPPARKEHLACKDYEAPAGKSERPAQLAFKERPAPLANAVRLDPEQQEQLVFKVPQGHKGRSELAYKALQAIAEQLALKGIKVALEFQRPVHLVLTALPERLGHEVRKAFKELKAYREHRDRPAFLAWLGPLAQRDPRALLAQAGFPDQMGNKELRDQLAQPAPRGRVDYKEPQEVESTSKPRRDLQRLKIWLERHRKTMTTSQHRQMGR